MAIAKLEMVAHHSDFASLMDWEYHSLGIVTDGILWVPVPICPVHRRLFTIEKPGFGPECDILFISGSEKHDKFYFLGLSIFADDVVKPVAHLLISVIVESCNKFRGIEIVPLLLGVGGFELVM